VLLALYRYNTCRYRRKIHLRSEQSLSERYQLSENIRTTRQLIPVLFLHLASNVEISAQTLSTYYGLLDQSSKECLYAFGGVFNAAVYFLIQLSVIK